MTNPTRRKTKRNPGGLSDVAMLALGAAAAAYLWMNRKSLGA